jgi:SHS2 domain-containing protein
MKKYRLLDHTADIGIEVYGQTKKEALANTVEAMFDLIVESDSIAALEEKQLSVSGVDTSDALINLLREALYLLHGQSWLCKTCEILEMEEEHITARLQGEPYDVKKHLLKMEIKAVTYHTLKIEQVADTNWRARVIFDV